MNRDEVHSSGWLKSVKNIGHDALLLGAIH